MRKHVPKLLPPEVLDSIRYMRTQPARKGKNKTPLKVDSHWKGKGARPARTYRGRRRNDARFDLCFGLKSERMMLALSRSDYDRLRMGKKGCYADE